MEDTNVEPESAEYCERGEEEGELRERWWADPPLGFGAEFERGRMGLGRDISRLVLERVRGGACLEEGFGASFLAWKA